MCGHESTVPKIAPGTQPQRRSPAVVFITR
jgi:hypothetical protein